MRAVGLRRDPARPVNSTNRSKRRHARK